MTDESNSASWEELLIPLRDERSRIEMGGGDKSIDRQHAKNRLTARERIAGLIDPGTDFFELGTWSAFGMYDEWGSAPAAGVVCGIAQVANRTFMVIANDDRFHLALPIHKQSNLSSSFKRQIGTFTSNI